MAYTPIGWLNDQAPAINQANLNKMDNELVKLDGESTDSISKINYISLMAKQYSEIKNPGYATLSSGKVRVYTSYAGSNTMIFDVSNSIGSRFSLTVTRTSGNTNVFYIFADDSGNSLELYSDSGTVTLTDKTITVPQSAKLLYVNYDNSVNNISLLEYKNMNGIQGEIDDINENIYYKKETVLQANNTYSNIYSYGNVGSSIATTNVSGTTTYLFILSDYQGKKLKVSTSCLDAGHQRAVTFLNTSSKIESIADGDLSSYVVNIPNNAVSAYVNCESESEPTVILVEDLNITDVYNELTGSLSINSRIQGKKCVCFGDSITWYDGETYNWGKEQGQVCKGYESYLHEAGMEVNNQGYSGASIRLIVNNRILPFDFTGYDYVTVTSGANDSRKGIPVGEIAETGSTFDNTFIGRLQAGIEHILDSNPEIKILLITPIRGWIYTPAGYDRPTPPETDGVVEEVYADAIKAVAEYYAIPVCDWYNDCGCNILTREWYINDPEPDKSATPNPNILYLLHPSTKGYKRMADLLLPVIRNI